MGYILFSHYIFDPLLKKLIDVEIYKLKWAFHKQKRHPLTIYQNFPK